MTEPHKETNEDEMENQTKSADVPDAINTNDILLNNAQIYTQTFDTVKAQHPKLSLQEMSTFVTMEYKKRISQTTTLK